MVTAVAPASSFSITFDLPTTLAWQQVAKWTYEFLIDNSMELTVPVPFAKEQLLSEPDLEVFTNVLLKQQ